MLKITSANYNVQNVETQQYNITASVSVGGDGNVQHITGGNVYDRASGVRVAEFSNYESLSVTFHDSDAAAILTAIDAFIEEAKARFTIPTTENV